MRLDKISPCPILEGGDTKRVAYHNVPVSKCSGLHVTLKPHKKQSFLYFTTLFT